MRRVAGNFMPAIMQTPECRLEESQHHCFYFATCDCQRCQVETRVMLRAGSRPTAQPAHQFVFWACVPDMRAV